MGLVIGVFLRFRLAFATRPYRKFTDDNRPLDAVLRRLVTGADAIKGDTRSYTSPSDMNCLKKMWGKKMSKLSSEDSGKGKRSGPHDDALIGVRFAESLPFALAAAGYFENLSISRLALLYARIASHTN